MLKVAKYFIMGMVMMAAFSAQTYATAQYADILIYNNEKVPILTNPMEGYFEAHPEKRPSSGLMSTALWRGYVATFEVKEKKLTVKDIEIQVHGKDHNIEFKSVYESVFPDQPDVKVEWFSGHLIVPTGELTEYRHMGYGSTYSKYLVIRVERGVVTDEREMKKREFVKFRKAQWEAFKKTQEYRDIVEEMKADEKEDSSLKMEESRTEQFMMEYYAAQYVSMIFNEETKK